MKIAIIKYNAGNNFSVECALKRIGYNAVITDDPDVIHSADRIIFPGVGEASSAMTYLKEHGLNKIITDLKQPVLGICIGQQLMCSHSEEGDIDCLGIFDAPVLKFNAKDSKCKIPHMGWNTLSNINSFIPKEFENEYVYYVHSYYVPLNTYTVAETNYIHPFSAALHKNNFYATQFHPEKSGDIGELILKQFIEL